MVSVYIFLVGIIEILTFILWKKRRKTIEKTGLYVDAIILNTNLIIGKPNRYRFEVEFNDISNCKRGQTIIVNGNIGKNYQEIGRIPVIYMASSNKLYLQRESLGETLLCIIIIMITFMFALLCLEIY